MSVCPSVRLHVRVLMSDVTVSSEHFFPQIWVRVIYCRNHLFAGQAVEADRLAPVRHTEDVVGLVLARVPGQPPNGARLQMIISHLNAIVVVSANYIE